MKSVHLAVGFSGVVYISIGLLGLFSFGTSIETSVLDNVATESSCWESYLLRIIFMVVLACHIPFFFYTGKESTLIIFDELDRGSIDLQMTLMKNGDET